MPTFLPSITRQKISMASPNLIFTFILFFAMSYSMEATAAVPCTHNKLAGSHENTKSGKSNPCDIHNLYSAIDIAPDKFISEVSELKASRPLAAKQTTDQDSQAWAKEAITPTSTSTQKIDQLHWDLLAEDGSIYAAIKRWSVTAGWQVSWEIPVDFPIEILDSSADSFENSVRRVLAAFRISDYPPYPCFHENKVVRVVRRIQGNDDECTQ